MMVNRKKAVFASQAELADWLVHYQIPVAQWGHGQAKTVAALWQEIASGEAELWVDPPLRVIRVVKMKVRSGWQSNLVLMEVEQILRDGRHRSRNQIPGEKIMRNETVEAAALRGLYEEVGVAVEAVQFVRVPDEPEIEERASPSFPGLLTQYWFYMAEVMVKGLPEAEFWTAERGEDDPTVKHRWKWVEEEGYDHDHT